MSKKIVLGIALALLLTTSAASVAIADEDESEGEADLVTKSGAPSWAITGYWGEAEYEAEDEAGSFEVEVDEGVLTPGNWYYVELVDKGADCSSWTVVNDDRYSRFYGQADEDGELEMDFTWDISGYDYVEVNVKNADWVALEDPSDYGNEDGDWLYTGQGWDYVLYASNTVPDSCVSP